MTTTKQEGTAVTRAPQTVIGKLGDQGAENFRNSLLNMRDQFAVALGDRIPPEHFIEVALTAYLDPKNKLAKCQPLSLVRALMRCAQMKLRPDGKECAIIPRGEIAEAEPMVQGIIRTMLRTRTVLKVEARVVYSGDRFEYAYGLAPKCEHVPGPTSDQGGVTHSYAIVWLTNGQTQFEVIDREELDKIQRITKQQNNGKLGPAWTNYPDEMYRKIAVKRLSKYIEQNAELAAVIEYDNQLQEGLVDPDLRDMLPHLEDRTLEQRAEQHLHRRTEELRVEMQQRAQPAQEAPQEPVQDAAVVETPDVGVLDRPLAWGKYKGRTIRELLDGPNRGYVTHWMVTEKCTALTAEERADVAAAVEAFDVSQGDAHHYDEKASESEGAQEAAAKDVPQAPEPW